MKNSYQRLTLTEREELSKGLWAGESFGSIARRLGRSTSTISREVKNNVKRKRRSYHASLAEQRSLEQRKRGRPKVLENNNRLRGYVYEKLGLEWSPQEIAKRMQMEYPKDKAMRISHETIYQHIYCLPKGELKKELIRALRQKRKQRLSRKHAHYRKQRIQDLISIEERPKEVEDRTVPGHWEGDLILGKNRKSALGTLVERSARLTLLVPLKKKDALSVSQAFAKAFKRIPDQFKKTLTYDRGLEMVRHKEFSKKSKVKVFFADPHSPWQRGTNENTNGLIRQYFPKGTDFNTIRAVEIKKVEQRLNSRPRKTLNFYTPSEIFYQLITGKKISVALED